MSGKHPHIREVDDNYMSEITQTTGGGSGEPPDLDARLRHVEADIAVIKSNYATREDLGNLRAEMHSLMRQTVMWFTGIAVALVGATFAIARFVT